MNARMILFFIALFVCNSGFGQKDDPCYTYLKNKGLRLINEEKYPAGLNAYLAALSCNDGNRTELAGFIREALIKWNMDLVRSRDAALDAQHQARLQRDSAIAARQNESQARKIAESQSKKNKALSYASVAEQEADRDIIKGLRLGQLGYELTDTALPRVKLALSNIISTQFSERDYNGNSIRTGQLIPTREFNIKPGNYNIYVDEEFLFLFDQIHGYSVFDKDSITELIDLIYAPTVPLNLSADLNYFSCGIDDIPTICGLKKYSKTYLAKPSSSLWGRICFSKSGQLFGGYTQDGIFNIWDKSGNVIFNRPISNSINYEKIQFILNDSSIFIHGDTALASGQTYRAAKIWNFYSDKIIDLGFVKDATQVEFSNDGANFIITEIEGSLALYNNSGSLLKHLEIPQHLNGYAAFSADDARIYVFCDDGSVFIFDKKGKLIGNFKSPSSVNYSPSFASNGQIITNSGVASFIFDQKGNLIKKITDPEGIRLSFFSPDGTKILSKCEYGSIIIWNSWGNKLHRVNSYIAQNKGFGATGTMLSDAKFTADSKGVLVVFSDGKFQWFDFAGILVGEIASPDKSASCISFFNNDDKKIIFNNQYVFDRNNLDKYIKINFPGDGFITPDRNHLISVSRENNCVMQTDNDKYWCNRDLDPPYYFSPNGSEMITFSFSPFNGSRYALLWNIDNGLVDSINIESVDQSKVNNMIEIGGENAVFIKSDSAVILSANSYIPFLYNIVNKKRINIIEKNELVRSVDASECSREILTFSTDSILRIWSFEGRLLDTFKILCNVYDFEVKFSPCGENILFWSQLRMFFLNRKARARKEADRLFRDTGDFNNIVFSKRNHLFLTTEYSGSTVSVWDYTGTRRFFFRAHAPNMTFQATFSPDERHVLTYSHDGTAKLWDIAYNGKGNNLIGLYKSAAEVNTGDFSSDGKYLMIASNDGTARIYPVPETIYEWVKNGTYPIVTLEELINLGLEEQ